MQPTTPAETSHDPSPTYAPRLGAILSAQVLNGTSNNFLLPFSATEATTVFSRVLPSLKIANGPGGVLMWIARLPPGETPLPSTDIDGNATGADDVIGSVQLAFHMAPNGRFRSEVRKLLVDKRYQRRGIGRQLMLQLEVAAKAGGSTLCVSFIFSPLFFGHLSSNILPHHITRRASRRSSRNEGICQIHEGSAKRQLLDTEQEGPGEALYKSMGWETAGIVPNYALVPNGEKKNGAVFMYKEF